jgi:hypothetical protein
MAEIQVRKDDLRHTRAVDGETRRDAVSQVKCSSTSSASR